MNPYRLGILLLAIVAVIVAGFVAALAGLWMCSPPPFPGDGWWTWKTRIANAIATTLSGSPHLCFLDGAAGRTLVTASRWTLPAVVFGVLAVAAWELAGIRLRQSLLGRWGGHAILAGEAGPLDRLSASSRARGGVLFLSLDGDAARRLQRRKPFSEIAILEDRGRAPQVLERLGVRHARTLAAATGSDLANLALCEAALAAGSRAELLLRLEQPSVRAVGSQSLRRRASDRGVALTSLSLTQMQVRRGSAQAMPGRYRDDAARRVHIAVCGGGPGVQEAAFHIARQGYGLDRSRPLLTVLRTGHRDFAAGALDRLAAATDAVELTLAAADASDPLALERAMAGAVLNGGRLCAVHCLGEHQGEALSLALCWERVLMDLGLPVPPIVVYGERGAPGETGMIRFAERIDLADAADAARLMDQRARIIHERYLEGQRRTQGEGFGTLPAEVEWPLLGEGYQDDNRHVADHIDYKLALAGFVAGARVRDGAGLADDDIERLARVEHARWTASKAIAGWRYGPTRDNAALIHDNMCPYDDLDLDAQRKDREEVAGLPQLLALGDAGLMRLRPAGAALAAAASCDADAVVSAVGAWQARNPSRRLLVRLPLDGEGPLALAEALLAAGVLLEVVQDRPLHSVFARAGNPALRPRAAAVLGCAHLIRAVEQRTAREAIVDDTPILVDSKGGLHAAALD